METNQDCAEIARLNKEVQLWQKRFRAAVDMLVLFSKERDDAVRMADAECCGKRPYFDVTI